MEQLIDVLEGSILLHEVEPNFTRIQFIEHLGAVMAGTDDIESYLEDMFASIAAVSKGDPLPEY